jgi:zinc D-Ala-D-Ala carboxypeptidase
MSKTRTRLGFPSRSLLVAVCAALTAAGCEPARGAGCAAGPRGAAGPNLASLAGLRWAPFGRPEIGWRAYEPLAAREIGSLCPAESPGFAAALASWQSAHGLAGRGVMDGATLSLMRDLWQARRPFVALSRRACPAPPAPAALARASPAESYGGKIILLRPAALAAYRAMVAAARRASPPIGPDPRLLTIFSAFRDPAYDEARCAAERNCQGVTRAACSAHRTGLAVDLFLGAQPGFRPDSAADANRLYLSRSRAYRWLVANAARFGFVNYPFEPWHWEWTGQPIPGPGRAG